jgi:ubiquinone/menaquinone biosynthesis C-methylase UbiE
MKTTTPIACLLALALCTGGCSILGKMDLGRVVTSGRDGWQHPERVIESLELAPGDHVAEIGAGDGYWLPWLSEAVGADGRIYAVEVDDEKIAVLRERVAEEDLANVIVVRGQFDDPALPDGEIDLAMTCLTYHHIEGRAEYFARLKSDLSPDGRVAHLDDRHDAGAPFRWLQGDGHWSDPEALHAEMREAGYHRTLEFDYLPLQSFQVFAPSAAESAAVESDALEGHAPDARSLEQTRH